MEKQKNYGVANWFDFPVSNFEKSQSFYGPLLGWSFEKLDENYSFIHPSTNSEHIGGMRIQDSAERGQGAVLYFEVEKIQPAVERALELGADKVGDLVPMGEQSWFQLLKDHDNNVFAVWADESAK